MTDNSDILKQVRPHFDRIPYELKTLAQWVLWRTETRDDKPTKVPYSADGAKARSNDPSTWMDYEDAVTLVDDYDGIGFMFTEEDPYAGFDIDDMTEGDSRLAFARMLHSYSERSQSGKGLHVIVQAKKPGERCKNTKLRVELYDSGRFFCMTGDHIEGFPETIEKRQDEIETLYSLIFPQTQPKPKQVRQESQPDAALPTDDGELWNRMFAAKNGADVEALYNGDWSRYDSQSDADMALMNHLAFWSGADDTRMERMFGQSALGQRSKWMDRADYRQGLVAKALADVSETYSSRHYGPSPHSSPTETEPIRTNGTASYLLSEGYDDYGNSECMRHHYGDQFKYTNSFGWLHWTGTHWDATKGEADVKEAARELLYLRRNAIAQVDQNGSTNTNGVKPSTTNVRNCLYQFQAIATVTGEAFDNEPHLLNCANGVVNLRTGELVTHEPSNRFTYCVPVEYRPEAAADLWERTLLDVMAGDLDKVAYLKRALGYTLTGETREECLFYLYGQNGRNGKGTVVNTVLELLGYPLGQATSFDTFSNKRNDPQGFLLAPLRNARMVAASESKRQERLNEAVVKMLTGRDSFQVAYKGKTPFVMTPNYKIWLMSNQPIRGDTNDNAFWHRFRLIEFTKTFQGAENKGLKCELLSPASKCGILSWLVLGAMQWYRNGLGEPQSVWDAVTEQREEQDIMRQFIRECLVERKNERTDLTDVYQVYKIWCEDNGLRATSKAYLSRQLREKGIEPQRRGKYPNQFQAVDGYRIHPDYESKPVAAHANR